jgi:hypothetical protein
MHQLMADISSDSHCTSLSQNAVCLADYCDVLDCFHRTVSFDPLTGEVMTPRSEGALYGSASARARRTAAAEATQLGLSKGSGGRLDDGVEPGAGAGLGSDMEHPHSRRCNVHAMEVARIKCQSLLLQCLPTGGEHGLPAREARDLHDRIHATICEPLRCTADGLHQNAVSLVESRAGESRARLWTILLALLVFAIAVFYFLVYNLRGEFGWKSTGAASLTAHHKQRQVSRLAQWIGMQQKKRTAPSKII